MKRFDQYMQHFADLDGWFQTPAIAIWDSLLSYQQEQRITGNLLEIGVWKGSLLPWPRFTAKVRTLVSLWMLYLWTRLRRASVRSCLQPLAIISRNNRSFSLGIPSSPRVRGLFAGFTWTANTVRSR